MNFAITEFYEDELPRLDVLRSSRQAEGRGIMFAGGYEVDREPPMRTGFMQSNGKERVANGDAIGTEV